MQRTMSGSHNLAEAREFITRKPPFNIMIHRWVQTFRLLNFTPTVDSAPLNPEIGLQRTGKLDPKLDPNWWGEP
jgi:hypothetical protein